MKFRYKFDVIIILLISIIKSLIVCKKLDNNVNPNTKIYSSDSVIKSEAEVWLTVSSLAQFDRKLNQTIERQLELNWRRVLTGSGDQWIGLFSEKPNENTLKEKGKQYSIEFVIIDGQTDGSHRTSIQFPYKKFSEKNLHLKCLKYWIALIKADKVLAEECLKINPFWMEKSVDAIGDMSLLELMIPGTHNSASYGRFSHKDNTLMSKYSLCQDETVFNQLVYGIRFLDLRVAYDTVNGNRSKLWIVHGPVPMKQTLDSVLLQVRRFVELAPKEVLVIDFHRFEKGFNKDEISQRLLRRHHRKVLALILKHLSAYLVPQTMGLHSTLNQLIANNKRVIVGYASDQYLSNKTFVFPKARHLWPNTDDTEELVEYFNETLCDIYPNQLFSAMVQLTADKFGIIIDRYNGLRTMAHTVNPEIAKGFSADSPLGWANCANVVASDFFLSNNLIDISIKTNLNRSKRSANHTKMDSKLN